MHSESCTMHGICSTKQGKCNQYDFPVLPANTATHHRKEKFSDLRYVTCDYYD